MNSGIKSLVLSARQHGVDLSLEKLVQTYSLDEKEPEVSKLIKIANENQLKATKIRASWEQLAEMGKAFPVIAYLKNGRFAIFVNFFKGENGTSDQIAVLDPLSSNPKLEKVDKAKILSTWDGDLILIKRHYSLLDEDQPVTTGWVFMELLKQKVLLTQLFIITMIMHVFGFLPIFFIMTVLDTVVSKGAYSTLYVIAVGVCIAHVFNGLFGYLKKYLSLFVTSIIEAKLSVKAFNSVMELPMMYFNQNQSSQVIKSVQQVDAVRKFLTVKLFGTVLEATSLLLFVPVMILYSPMLFGVVFIFSVLIGINNVVSAKQQRDALKNMTTSDLRRQSLLMNSISGIETVKSLTLENLQKKQWEEYAAQAISADVKFWQENSKSSQVSSTLQAIMGVAVIFVGTLLVIDKSLSAGVLIGANMLATKITGPLVQFFSLATDFKMFEMSMQALSGVIEGRKELHRQGVCPQIKGAIEFRDVSFEYNEGQPVIENVSFKIEPRQRIAIVGTSGSGKSTLTRLIMGLLRPQSGNILIDGVDTRTMDIGHLRMNISYVESQNTFFRETIRDNIVKAMPNAPMERVHWASKLCDLHREVEQMPDGYETMLDEGGTNLSSGQRQKLAIARALLRNPRIVIFDEAISNLGIADLISLRENMDDISSGRTMVTITHSISQIADNDLILVLDKGRLVESGTHNTLLQNNGLYSSMFQKEKILYGGAS